MGPFIFWLIMAGLLLAFSVLAAYGDDDDDDEIVAFSDEDREFEDK